MKLLRAITVVVVLLSTSCGQEPPLYDSRYVPPSTVSSAPVGRSLAPPLASFVEDFNRADTSLGLGSGWDLRGAMTAADEAPPPATDGFIRNGAFTYAGHSTVYAVREFQAPVRSVGAAGSFRRNGSGPETALVMLLTADSRIGSNVIHFDATRRSWRLGVRDGAGVMRYKAKRDITPPLEPGQPYTFEISVSDQRVVVRIGDEGESVHVPGATELVGNRAVWGEHKLGSEPAGDAFSFDTVWSEVENQPTTLVALPPGTS